MKLKNKGFTLIEIIIVVSIVGILMLMAYAPYSVFGRSSEVKIASKSIAKTLSESRNMAIHGANSNSGNLSIGVYFDIKEKNRIKIFAYPYSYGTGSSIIVNDSGLIFREIDIGKNIWIEKVEDKGKVLILFEAITGNGYYFNFDEGKEILSITDDDILNIEFSYKGATNFLRKDLQYYIKTHISDY